MREVLIFVNFKPFYNFVRILPRFFRFWDWFFVNIYWQWLFDFLQVFLKLFINILLLLLLDISWHLSFLSVEKNILPEKLILIILSFNVDNNSRDMFLNLMFSIIFVKTFWKCLKFQIRGGYCLDLRLSFFLISKLILFLLLLLFLLEIFDSKGKLHILFAWKTV